MVKYQEAETIVYQRLFAWIRYHYLEMRIIDCFLSVLNYPITNSDIHWPDIIPGLIVSMRHIQQKRNEISHFSPS